MTRQCSTNKTPQQAGYNNELKIVSLQTGFSGHMAISFRGSSAGVRWTRLFFCSLTKTEQMEKPNIAIFHSHFKFSDHAWYLRNQILIKLKII